MSDRGTPHLLVLFPVVCIFVDIFQELLFPWQPSLVGISVRASVWLGRVTGQGAKARGVTSFQSPHQSQSVPATSIMQVSLAILLDLKHIEVEAEPNVGFLLNVGEQQECRRGISDVRRECGVVYVHTSSSHQRFTSK